MDYDSYVENNYTTNKCGSKVSAYLYFVSFIIICVQIFLNLFVAVVVDSYDNQAEKAALPI